MVAAGDAPTLSGPVPLTRYILTHPSTKCVLNHLRDVYGIDAEYVPLSGHACRRGVAAYTPLHIDRFYVIRALGYSERRLEYAQKQMRAAYSTLQQLMQNASTQPEFCGENMRGCSPPAPLEISVPFGDPTKSIALVSKWMLHSSSEERSGSREVDAILEFKEKCFAHLPIFVAILQRRMD
ncbi:hypothetical protein BVRB_037590, partial [Beta vulgaris subsp. vulgaris]